MKAESKDKNEKEPIVSVGIGLNIGREAVRKYYDKNIQQPGIIQRNLKIL